MKIKELLTSDKIGKKGIYILLLLGVLLLALGSAAEKTQKNAEKAPEPVPKEKTDYFPELEKRLCEILSQIDGAGKVSVMIVGDNSGSVNVEKDKNGESSQTVVLNSQGESEALIREESYPNVRGVIIVSQGAKNDTVRSEIANAAATVLGVGVHRVGVYKMKN